MRTPGRHSFNRLYLPAESPKTRAKLMKHSNVARLDGPCRMHAKSQQRQDMQLVLKTQQEMVTLIPSDLSAVFINF